MSVKKSLLEAMSTEELNDYIKVGNRFVPEANIYAYEILKARGLEIPEAETLRIMSLISDRNKSEELIIHPNHKKAGNLIYLTAALGLINVLLSPETFQNTLGIIVGVFTLGIIFGIGYLAGKGNDRIKYVLLVFMILGLLSIPFIILNIVNNPLVGKINIIQTALQIYALVLLFKIPRSN